MKYSKKRWGCASYACNKTDSRPDRIVETEKGCYDKKKIYSVVRDMAGSNDLRRLFTNN